MLQLYWQPRIGEILQAHLCYAVIFFIVFQVPTYSFYSPTKFLLFIISDNPVSPILLYSISHQIYSKTIQITSTIMNYPNVLCLQQWCCYSLSYPIIFTQTQDLQIRPHELDHLFNIIIINLAIIWIIR